MIPELEYYKNLQKIHIQDSVDIEELFRLFVFSDFPKNPGREVYLSELIGTSVGEAMYILKSLYEGLLEEGDVCEFGVAQGSTSRLLAFELMNTNRNLYLFDSFEGLPSPSKEDILINDIFNLKTIDSYKGTMKCSENEVLEKLEKIKFPIDRVHIIKGWIEESLIREDLPKRIIFAYVDFDFYEPTKRALEYLDQVMPIGGRIVVDDYKFFSSGVQKAVDEFINSRRKRFSIHFPLSFIGKFVMLRREREL